MAYIAKPQLKIGWKTVGGAVLWGLGQVARPEVLNVLPEKVAGVITVAGGLLALFGIRHAQAKTQSAAEQAALEAEAAGAEVRSRVAAR